MKRRTFWIYKSIDKIKSKFFDSERVPGYFYRIKLTLKEKEIINKLYKDFNNFKKLFLYKNVSLGSYLDKLHENIGHKFYFGLEASKLATAQHISNDLLKMAHDNIVELQHAINNFQMHLNQISLVKAKIIRNTGEPETELIGYLNFLIKSGEENNIRRASNLIKNMKSQPGLN